MKVLLTLVLLIAHFQTFGQRNKELLGSWYYCHLDGLYEEVHFEGNYLRRFLGDMDWMFGNRILYYKISNDSITYSLAPLHLTTEYPIFQTQLRFLSNTTLLLNISDRIDTLSRLNMIYSPQPKSNLEDTWEDEFEEEFIGRAIRANCTDKRPLSVRLADTIKIDLGEVTPDFEEVSYHYEQIYFLKSKPAAPPIEWDSIYQIIDNYLIDNISKIEFSIDGKVKIGFTIDQEGSLGNLHINKSMKSDYDSLAINAIRQIPPKWFPCFDQGTFIDQEIVIPLTFKSNLNTAKSYSAYPLEPSKLGSDNKLFAKVLRQVYNQVFSGEIVLSESSRKPTYIKFYLTGNDEITSFRYISGNEKLFSSLKPHLLKHYKFQSKVKQGKYIILGLGLNR